MANSFWVAMGIILLSGVSYGVSVAMALLTLGAFIGYGTGAVVMGRYGTSVGWALFVAGTVVASNLSGLIMGEWRDTSQHTRRLLLAAMAVVLATVVVLNLGGIF